MKQQIDGQLNGLVLDLRNNPGGLLDSSIEVSDTFLDGGKYSTKFNRIHSRSPASYPITC